MRQRRQCELECACGNPAISAQPDTTARPFARSTTCLCRFRGPLWHTRHLTSPGISIYLRMIISLEYSPDNHTQSDDASQHKNRISCFRAELPDLVRSNPLLSCSESRK